MVRQKIIVIVGPTASGKSDLAIKLAQRISAKGATSASGTRSAPYRGAEIISADSRQVYRGMDIGTGKVVRDKSRNLKDKNSKIKNEEFYSAGIQHHLIDVVSPKEIFTVSDFKLRAEKAIADITHRGKLPIIVGGTGQYIDTLVFDLSIPEVPPNYKLRAKLEEQTTEQLFSQLKKLDPERANNIDRHNPRRLIRALEIINYLGKVPPLNTRPTEQHQSFGRAKYEVLWLGLNPKDLDKRIPSRLSARFEQGMVAEVKKLHDSGVSWERLYDFGLEYRWVSEFLQDKIGQEEMLVGLERAICQYSKRQMTWFKRNQKIHWLSSIDEVEKLTDEFIKN